MLQNKPTCSAPLLLHCLLVILMLAFSTPLKAQFWEKVFKDEEEKKQGFAILPLLYYTPDTRFGYGLMGAYYFKADKDTASDTRLSYTKALADYTQNDQIDVWQSWEIFTKEEHFLLKGEFRYRNFPDRFYGVGNRTPEAAEEFYSYDFINLKKLVLRRIGDGIFIGGDLQFTHFFNLDFSRSQTLSDGAITGTAQRSSNSSGLGAVFLIDRRDNVVAASEGIYFEIASYFFEPAFGSDFHYQHYSIEFRNYHHLGNNHIIAFNALSTLNFGEVPFITMSFVGGEQMLRGYPQNRYRDRHFVGSQAEYRFPLIGRLGGVSFLGLGEVFEQSRQVTWSNLKYSYGAGLRFAINKRERLNLRFDYAFGRDSQTFYFTLTEAF